MSLLSLPPVPPELKPVTPFLQRAEEVKASDPVIAYWCAYYAAQLGIALKLKDNAARTYLFDLLGVLEGMKKEIGANDAIDDESASSAYVENFAIRVFAGADNEDRKGNPTRTTAKKFLAAANFLEVLNVFSQTSDAATTTINVPEKIRYAKWKAADIAKAFREGRKPTPGAPGEATPAADEAIPPPASPPPSTSRPDSASPPAIHRSTPPPGPIDDFPTASHPGYTATEVPPHEDGPMSPGAWSTVATPGTPDQFTHPSSISGSGPKQSALRKAWISGELEGRDEDNDDVGSSDDGIGGGGVASRASSDPKTVHFTPSVTGGLTPSDVQPMDEPFASPLPPSPGADREPPDFLPSVPVFNPEYSPPPEATFPPSVMPHVPPPSIPHLSSRLPPPPPMRPYPPVQQPAFLPPTADATITNPPEELTPKRVTQIQKHCRFAISALDYEDADTARKELRAALAMLGG